jgi:hypothetical protein
VAQLKSEIPATRLRRKFEMYWLPSEFDSPVCRSANPQSGPALARSPQ